MDDLTTEESRVITEIVPATPLPRLHDHTMPADGGQASSVLAQKMSEFLEYMEVEKG